MAEASIGAADTAKVKVLFNLLNKTLNEELAKHNYSHVDVFMASHNLHKFITLGLEQQTRDRACVWRQMCITTMDEALKLAPPFKVE